MRVLGQLQFSDGGWGDLERGELYGLPVLRAQTDPQGWLGGYRLRRAGKKLHRGGAFHALVPQKFEYWPTLNGCGIMPVNPLPLVRAQSAGFALETLKRQGRNPERSTVALRGTYADHDMKRAAVRLCEQVRNLVITAPNGGEELALWLRWKYGMPVLPPEEGAEVAVCFEPVPSKADTVLGLYGDKPELGGLNLVAPGLKKEDKRDLSLLFSLWEGGILGECDLKIT